MSGFRIGDRQCEIGGVSTRLRLSISALAEIADGLNAASAKDLAARLRRANAADWMIILRAVATPSPAKNISESDLLKLVPILSSLISEGFAS